MLTSETQALTQSGWVEVSGWDEDEIFFVERAELGWDEFAGKHVTLTRMLSEGSIIFVRPIQPTTTQRANYGKNIAGLTRRAQTVLLQHP